MKKLSFHSRLQEINQKLIQKVFSPGSLTTIGGVSGLLGSNVNAFS